MGAAVAPPAGFNSTMQLPKRQLSKIIVLVELVEFVIYGGLRTPWVYRSSYALMVRFYRNQRVCLCTHTLVFSYRTHTAQKAPLFPPLNELLVGSIGSIVNSTLANDSKKLAL